MSQKLVRSLLISGGLLLILILIIAVNNMILIQGPYFKQLSDDQRIHRQLMQQLRSTDGELLGRYALNEVTYISRVSLYGENWIYWYDAEGNVRAVLRRSQIDEQAALEAARQCCSYAGNEISYGWINDRPALVLEDSRQEILLDAESLELLLRYEKR